MALRHARDIRHPATRPTRRASGRPRRRRAGSRAVSAREPRADPAHAELRAHRRATAHAARAPVRRRRRQGDKETRRQGDRRPPIADRRRPDRHRRFDPWAPVAVTVLCSDPEAVGRREREVAERCRPGPGARGHCPAVGAPEIAKVFLARVPVVLRQHVGLRPRRDSAARSSLRTRSTRNSVA